ncbi:MAG: tRNA (adenosine(37)-N6)-threonylcarbamoyltransferase complex ATPase subunit type 1 TsaE [Planctomycetota bacterium]
MRLVLRSTSRAATVALGRALGASIEPLPRGGFVVVLLGDLGAGKTVFAGGIAAGLGVPATSPVVSPTFTFARGYRGRVPMFHLDAYLVRSAGDLEASGYEELGGEGRVTVVEWGDRIASALPADRLEVTILPDPGAAAAAPAAAPPAGVAAPAGASRPSRRPGGGWRSSPAARKPSACWRV